MLNFSKVNKHENESQFRFKKKGDERLKSGLINSCFELEINGKLVSHFLFKYFISVDFDDFFLSVMFSHFLIVFFSFLRSPPPSSSSSSSSVFAPGVHLPWFYGWIDR